MLTRRTRSFFRSRQRLFGLSYASLVLLFASGGCSQSTPKTELTMQVQPLGQTGLYSVSGRTNLPDQTRITVQAVRDLKSAADSQLTNDRPIYSILGRTQIVVQNGQWQTNLNLLQPTAEGQALEMWQIQNPQLRWQPDNRVSFLAVTDPVNQPLDVGQTAAGQENVSIRFTADGKSYVRAEQVIAIEPPSAKIAARSTPSLMVQSVPVQPVSGAVELKRQTDMPLAPSAIAR